MTYLKVGTYNLLDGGLGDDDSRLRRQLDVLKEQCLDIVALQEAKHWNQDGAKPFHLAQSVLGMRGYLAQSAHHGCHLVTLVGPRVRVIEERHETGHPYWHGVNVLRTEIDGKPVDLINAHLAPSVPEIRVQEARALRLLVGSRPVIACGDWNAAALEDDPRIAEDANPARSELKTDRGPAQALLDAGLVDVGGYLHDLTPTVGHARAGSGVSYRADRIYTTDPEAASDHRLIAGDDSDHALVMAGFGHVPRS
ncbi:hypothetical protein Misp01_46760 [Microtetraspora sp. NBRC 13810]|uniref:endonuclease/exonuclease/phosphatase family protein n=1 Tax=Microtetraspora sp. NBRC 13810 TaxID=3030990 RepID=UPI0024A50E33|nr:endonuclease/exonuclease/phosphatase family protein [Microtetraspora sp. NBRC 13810]GLW09547.1 hypothetical protein Misp01_46760 [Microtetraspora sp. NBRC 13810]